MLRSTMILSILASGTVLLASACRPRSQSGMDILSVLPDSNQVAGWVRSNRVRTFEADRLWEYIDGDAERFVQAGVVRALTADYTYKGNVDAVADVYIMKTPEGAKRIFDSESSVGSEQVAIGDGGRLYKTTLVFHQGRHFVRLVAYQESPGIQDALVQLGRAVSLRLSANQLSAVSGSVLK